MPTLLEDRPRHDASASDGGAPAQEVVVRVVTEDRGDRSSPPRRESRRARRVTIRGTITAVVLGAIAVGVFLLVGAVGGLLSFAPFSSSTVDRTPPALLKQMQNLEQFRAARGTFEVNIDVEHDVNLLPGFIAGDRTIFNAIGTVDANVDFSRLGADAVVVGNDGAVTVNLPTPNYAKPVVDPGRSHVVARDRGLVNRLAGVFSDSPTGERDLYLLAGKKLDAAARESKLIARGEANTTSMLQGLIGKFGYSNVRVVFTPLVAPSDPSPK